MRQWHHHSSGQKHGPVSDDELRSKIVDGTLPGNTLIWEVGTKDWVELCDHPELGKLVQVPPPLPTVASIGTHSRGILTGVADAIPPLGVVLPWVMFAVAIYIAPTTQHNNQPANASENWMGAVIVGATLLTIAFIALLRPRKQNYSVAKLWRRLIAKSIDVSLAGIATLLILWVAATNGIVIGAGTAILVAWFGAFLVWLVVDWLSLNAYGTSLGRKLMGVRIEPTDPDNPGFLRRSLSVYTLGLALGFPLFTGLAQAIAYKRLREHGTTSWDRGRFSVIFSEIGVGQIALGLAILLFASSLATGIGSSISGALAEVERNRQAEEAKMANSWKNPITGKEVSLPMRLAISRDNHHMAKFDLYSYKAHAWIGHWSSLEAYRAAQIKDSPRDERGPGMLVADALVIDNWTVRTEEHPLGENIEWDLVVISDVSGETWVIEVIGWSNLSREKKSTTCSVAKALGESFGFNGWDRVVRTNRVRLCNDG